MVAPGGQGTRGTRHLDRALSALHSVRFIFISGLLKLEFSGDLGAFLMNFYTARWRDLIVNVKPFRLSARFYCGNEEDTEVIPPKTNSRVQTDKPWSWDDHGHGHQGDTWWTDRRLPSGLIAVSESQITVKPDCLQKSPPHLLQQSTGRLVVYTLRPC